MYGKGWTRTTHGMMDGRDGGREGAVFSKTSIHFLFTACQLWTTCLHSTTYCPEDGLLPDGPFFGGRFNCRAGRLSFNPFLYRSFVHKILLSSTMNTKQRCRIRFVGRLRSVTQAGRSIQTSYLTLNQVRAVTATWISCSC